MTRTHKNFKVRPRIERAFLDWLGGTRQRFALPIRITKRTDRHIEWLYVGADPIVYGRLTRQQEIQLCFSRHCWDCMKLFEASSQPA